MQIPRHFTIRGEDPFAAFKLAPRTSRIVNPDGSLVNCVPPPCLSPTGPIAYLQEMLKLSPASSCDDPFAEPAAGQTTLGAAVTARRGPLGALLASGANLDTPLPLIDIVNECLEYLGATQPPPAGSDQAAPSGTVYDTSADRLERSAGLAAGRRLRSECLRLLVERRGA